MLNIKKGDVLKWNPALGKGEAKILSVCDGIYALSKIIDHEAFDAWYTEKELRKAFILPEEKWEPDKEIIQGIKDAFYENEYVCEDFDPEEGRCHSCDSCKKNKLAQAKLDEILAVLKK